jgi:hypothetical protein
LNCVSIDSSNQLFFFFFEKEKKDEALEGLDCVSVYLVAEKNKFSVLLVGKRR